MPPEVPRPSAEFKDPLAGASIGGKTGNVGSIDYCPTEVRTDHPKSPTWEMI